MPPNLGGFFMVRSYYPSECHADYFDFERIEALKPAIEACGISTLSQSPMLGFHKQMDNRIKLLEESITHAYSIVIGSKHITLNATGGGFLTASKQFRHGATSKSRSNTASNSTK